MTGSATSSADGAPSAAGSDNRLQPASGEGDARIAGEGHSMVRESGSAYRHEVGRTCAAHRSMSQYIARVAGSSIEEF
jgi:hypothetical protein